MTTEQGYRDFWGQLSKGPNEATKDKNPRRLRDGIDCPLDLRCIGKVIMHGEPQPITAELDIEHCAEPYLETIICRDEERICQSTNTPAMTAATNLKHSCALVTHRRVPVVIQTNLRNCCRCLRPRVTPPRLHQLCLDRAAHADTLLGQVLADFID